MRNGSKIGVIGVAALLAVSVAVSPVAAVSPPPANDDFVDAVEVTVPFSEVLDTTGMTVGPYELAISAYCDYPAEAGGVWYKLQGTGKPVVIDLSGSNFNAFLGVAVGPQSDGTFSDVLMCDMHDHTLNTELGVTYYVAAYDERLTDGIGGSLHIAFYDQPEMSKVQVSVGRVGRVGRINKHKGAFRVHGTFTCLETEGDPVGFFLISGTMEQRFHGQLISYGWLTDLYRVCDGATHRWSAVGWNQLPAPHAGRATVTATASVCGRWGCADQVGEPQKVVLKRVQRRSLTVSSHAGLPWRTASESGAAVEITPHDLWSRIRGAAWIWRTPSPRNEITAFTKRFYISSKAKDLKATLRITADNAYRVYLNGSLVGANGPFSFEGPDESTWATVYQHKVRPRPGHNVLRVEALNYFGPAESPDNPAGVIFRLNVSYRDGG